jgi:ATP-binding cassette subfamily A (ABC1) protein 3
LLFTLPYAEKNNLLPVFEQLEKDQSIQIDLQMNTLEEAFINIGMDEEKFM